MRRSRKTVGAFVLTVAMVAPAACGDSPTQPDTTTTSTTAPPPSPPPQQAEPTIASVDIQGPDVLPLGQTIQYALIARLTDGTQRDVTSESTWSAGWGDAVALEAPGRLRGNAPGENLVEANFDRRHFRSKSVIVVPDGTFRLLGRILEDGFADDGVVGAAIEATSARGRIFGHTDLYGNYRLYGLVGSTRVRATKAGYHTAEETIVVEDHEQNLQLTLPLVKPRPEVAGTYALTLTAARTCDVGDGEGALPDDARRRTYEATLTQNGPALALVLTGGGLLRGRTDIRGWIEPHRIVFDLNWSGWEPWQITDQLGPSRWLLVDGVGTVNPSADGLAGRFGGRLTVSSSPDGGPPTASCVSADHGFSLTR
jgi:hypothetical protein